MKLNQSLIVGFFSGLGFALVMTVFSVMYMKHDFSIELFVFRLVLFGVIMGTSDYYHKNNKQTTD